MKKLLMASLAVSSLLVGVENVDAAMMSIDEFNSIVTSPHTVLSPTGLYNLLKVTKSLPTASLSETGLPTNETIGAQRQINFNYTSLDTVGKSYIQMSSDLGFLGISNGIGLPKQGANSQTTVTWNPAQNLAAYSHKGEFTIGLRDINPNPGASINLQLDVSDGVTTSSSTIPINTSHAFKAVSLPFSGFSDPTIFNHSLSSIALTIGGLPRYDIAIDYLRASGQPQPSGSTVPESSLAVGLIAAVGLEIWLSRKLRSK